MRSTITLPTLLRLSTRRPATARLATACLTAVLAATVAATVAACGEDGAAAGSGATPASTPTPSSTPMADSSPTTTQLVVEDPWVRATTGTEDPSMTAAFMVLDNEGAEEVTVTGASSPVAGMVQLHEMAMVDGSSVMRELPGGIVLAPGRGLLLQPGGTHVMLMDLTRELAPGDEVELVLELSDGSTVEVTAPVKEFTEEEGHYHSPGTDEHSH